MIWPLWETRAAISIEPLEASAIALIELSAKMIADTFPRRRADLARVARLFNEAFGYRWDRIIEFLKLHYLLSGRADSAFWIDNRSAATIPDALSDKLEFWRGHCPGGADFPQLDEIFPAASHQYILYGMGFRPAPSPWLGNPAIEARARDRLAECAQVARNLVGSLPAHRELLARIQRYGLQKI